MSAPTSAVRVATERGELAYWEISPAIYATEVRGHMTLPMARVIIEHADPLYARACPVYGFHNWLYMTSYDSVCRVELTAWALRHRAESVLHIALTSRLVAMGVTVANLALGDLIKVHPNLNALEAKLAAAMRA